MHAALGFTPAPYNLGLMAHSCDPSTWGEAGWRQVYVKFKIIFHMKLEVEIRTKF